MPSSSSASVGCSSVASASYNDSVQLDHQNGSTFVEWNEGAVVLEMKVNEQQAIVTIFCPLVDETEQKCVEVVKFAENSIEFIRDSTPENSKETCVRRYIATFPNQQFDPKSVSAEIWSENRRLFMCRVNLQYKDYVCGLRRFSEIQSYMSNKVPLQQYCERLTNNGVKVSCRVCLTTFLTTGEKNPMKFMNVNDDPILDELGNCELNDFVVHSCANQHGCHDKKKSDLLKIDEAKGGTKSNQPTADKSHLSDTYLTLKKTDDLTGVMIDAENFIVKCKGCLNELGHVLKINSNVLKLHLTGINIDDQNISRNLLAERFESLERYFAFLLLRHSGIDSSLKLVFRTCEKEPYVLIWLIEPISVFGGGKLKELKDDENEDKTKLRRNSTNNDTSIINTFCALKVLYRVFEPTSAGGDNFKNNAVDSSVSYIDIPLSSCMALEEILLRNSTRLPNSSRTLGNFLISFLNIDDE